jgi:hypothetical protein
MNVLSGNAPHLIMVEGKILQVQETGSRMGRRKNLAGTRSPDCATLFHRHTMVRSLFDLANVRNNNGVNERQACGRHPCNIYDAHWIVMCNYITLLNDVHMHNNYNAHSYDLMKSSMT